MDSFSDVSELERNEEEGLKSTSIIFFIFWAFCRAW